MKILIGLIFILLVILIALLGYVAIVGAPRPCEFGPCMGSLQK